MEKLASFHDPSKNMYVEKADVGKDIIDLVRITPGPKIGHKPLAHALKNSSKYGPEFVERCTENYHRSSGLVDDFIDTFEKHSHDNLVTPKDWTPMEVDLFITAIIFVFGTILKPRFKSFIIHWCDLFYLPWRWVKSAGWPYVCSPATRSKGRAWNKFTEYGRNVCHTIKEFTLDPWTCVLPLKNYIIMGYNRFHIASVNAFAKIRLVFGVPMILLACEMQLFAGYLFMIKHYRTSPIAYGREIYNGGMMYVNAMIPNGDVVICDDISGFDYHVTFWMIELVLTLIFRNYIDFTRYWPCLKEGGKYFHTTQPGNSLQRRFYNVLVIVIRWITSWKVLLPTGEFLYRRFAFLPSGMYMTNFLDSAINILMTYHVCLVLGMTVEEITFLIVLGDDLTFSIPRSVLNRLRLSANGFYRQFDATRRRLYNMSSGGTPRYVGTDKNQIVFLKYRNQKGRPIRNLEELTAGALVRERHLKPQHHASVLVGLAYAAVATCPEYHRCLEEAYEFCIKVGRDKGTPQTVDPEDRFLSQLQEDLGLSDADLLRFPKYEEVLEMVTTYKGDDIPEYYHNFSNEAFVYPTPALQYLFSEVTTIDPCTDIVEKFRI